MGCSPWGCKTAQVIAERTDSVCRPTQKPESASRRTDEHAHGCTRDTRTLAARARDLCAHTQGPATEGQSAPPALSAKPRAAAWQDTRGSRHAATCREQPASSLPSPHQSACRPTCALTPTGACRPQEAETGWWITSSPRSRPPLIHHSRETHSWVRSPDTPQPCAFPGRMRPTPAQSG